MLLVAGAGMTAAAGMAAPSRAAEICGAGFDAKPFNRDRYRCALTVQPVCRRWYRWEIPRFSLRGKARGKNLWLLVYRCDRAKAGSEPKPKFVRFCARGFRRFGAASGAHYECRRTVQVGCRPLYWPSALAQVQQSPPQATPWAFEYRCMKSPN
jgi:hypothetical protein